jgi:Gpi18-like mannosyltransferase
LIFPGAKAWRAGALLAFFPVSVFLLAGYAESLYIALFAWSVVALLERRPWLAAVLIGLLAVTRIEGVLLVLALIGWAVQDERTHRQRSLPRAAIRIAGLCVVSLGPLFGYLLFVRQRYGSFFEELTVNKLWHRHPSWPLHPLYTSLLWIFDNQIHRPQAANYVATYLVDDAAMVMAVIGLVALGMIVWKRRELWWLVPPVFVAWLIIASDAPFGISPEAWARNVMVLIPLYAVVSRIKSELGWSMLLAGSALFAALFQIIFNVGLWLT